MVRAPKAPVGVDAGVGAVSEENLPNDVLVLNSKGSYCKKWLDKATNDYIELLDQLETIGVTNNNNNKGKRKKREFAKVRFGYLYILEGCDTCLLITFDCLIFLPYHSRAL
jgi:hypothetical protein